MRVWSGSICAGGDTPAGHGVTGGGEWTSDCRDGLIHDLEFRPVDCRDGTVAAPKRAAFAQEWIEWLDAFVAAGQPVARTAE
jgi:hypothetical protein